MRSVSAPGTGRPPLPGVKNTKFVLDLFDKIGLGTEAFSKGRNAQLFSSNQKFTDRQKRMIRNCLIAGDPFGLGGGAAVWGGLGASSS